METFFDVSDRMKTDFPDGNFNYYPVGDDHAVTPEMVVEFWLWCMKLIGDDPIGVWSNGGDQLSGICNGDKRFDPRIHSGKYATVSHQKDFYVGNIKNSARGEKCLWQTAGNHTETTKDIIDAVGEIAKELGTAFVGRAVKAHFAPGLNVWDMHGRYRVNSMAGSFRQRRVNEGEMLKRRMSGLQGDCILMIMHHIHKMREAFPDSENKKFAIISGDDKKLKTHYMQPEYDSCGYIHEDMRWYISGGAFQKSQLQNEWRVDPTTGEKYYCILDSYALEYAPAELGMRRVRVRDWRIEGVDTITEADMLKE